MDWVITNKFDDVWKMIQNDPGFTYEWNKKKCNQGSNMRHVFQPWMNIFFTKELIGFGTQVSNKIETKL